ncbi:MAG: hypothetical protein HRU20_10090 [Pseudomonadales bacterium]|nr:hypothetical protein [Pseudomonadales bacterium]
MNFNSVSVFFICLLVSLSACDNLSNVDKQEDALPIASATVIGAVLSASNNESQKRYTVRAGSEVLLSGKDSEGVDDPLFQFNWRQTDNSGVVVQLIERSRNSRVFRVPDVTVSTQMIFELTVVDADGQEDSDTLSINIEPLSDNNRFLEFPLTTSNHYTVIPVLKQSYSATTVLQYSLIQSVWVNYADRNSVDGLANRPVDLMIAEAAVKTGEFPVISQMQGQTVQALKSNYLLPHISLRFPAVDIDDINKLYETENREKQLDLYALNSLETSVHHTLSFTAGECQNSANELVDCEQAFVLLLLNVNGRIIRLSDGLIAKSTLQELGDDSPDDVTQQAFETKRSARAYYAAIDPDNKRTTLSDWLNLAGFTDAAGNAILDKSQYAQGLYLNNYDLGFARDMVIRVDENTGNVYSYVLNYTSMEAALKNGKPLATVVMEFSPPDQDISKPPFVKFFIFVDDELGDQTRVLTFNFDGRGEKTVPSVCVTCHGGRPKSLTADDTYPDFGDVNGSFMPWDLDSFLFTDAANPKQIDPDINRAVFSQALLQKYSKENQQAQLRAMNAAVLATYVNDAERFADSKELIHGWYGSENVDALTLPNNEFDGSYVLSGWLGQEDLYHRGFAQYCRACHMQIFGSERFGQFADFAKVKEQIKSLIFSEGQMPLARLTADRFWINYHGEKSAAEAFATYFDITVAGQKPGSPVIIINGGEILTALDSSSREALLADGILTADNPILNQDTVRIDASDSLNASTYAWSFIDMPSSSTAVLLGANTASPSFNVDKPGQYRLQLIASNVIADSDPVQVLVDAEPLNPKKVVAGPAAMMEAATFIVDKNILQFIDLDSIDEDIVFHITTVPEHGRLQLNGSDITQFTQADINATNITYKHDGAEFATDTFRFIVNNDLVVADTDESFAFSFAIQATNDRPLLTMNEIYTVAEGGVEIISPSHLTYADADHGADEVIYTLLTLPVNGELRLNDLPLFMQSQFSQLNINQSELSYVHDGSETTVDSFSYAVADTAAAVGTSNTDFLIAITSIADIPTVVLKPLSVISGRTAVFTAAAIMNVAPNGNRDESIQVFDNDSDASQINLQLVRLPTEGELTLNGTAMNTATFFTLADVAAGSLRYQSQQNLSETNPVADTFNLKVINAGLPVLDLQGNTLIDIDDVGDVLISISTEAATDGPMITASNVILNGLSVLSNNTDETWPVNTLANSVVIDTAMLNVSDTDNTPATGFTYIVMALPTSGSLFLNAIELSLNDTFTQQDIDDNQLSYSHLLSGVPLQLVDSFSVNVTDDDGVTESQVVSIEKRVSLEHDVRKAFKLLAVDEVTRCTGCHAPASSCGVFPATICWLNNDGTVTLNNLTGLSSATRIYLWPATDNHMGGDLLTDGDLIYEILEACVNDGCF